MKVIDYILQHISEACLMRVNYFVQQFCDDVFTPFKSECALCEIPKTANLQEQSSSQCLSQLIPVQLKAL